MSEEEDKIPTGEIVKKNITGKMDRRFLSSIDFMGQGEVKVKIDRIEYLKSIKFKTGRTKEGVFLMYIKGTEKPLDLCATNIKALIANFGSKDPETWEGKEVVLKVEKVKNPKGGGLTDGVRVQ